MVSAAMVIITLLIFGLLLFRWDNPFAAIGTDMPGTDTNTEAAVVETEITDTATPTHTPNVPLTEQAAAAIAETENALRQTDIAAELTSIAQSATPSPTSTLTPTHTPTATHTSQPNTPRPTSTPTAYVRDLAGLIEDFEGAGTAARFNCQRFVVAYTFLVERLDADDPEFHPARDLIVGPDAPASLIYEDYCQDEPENTSVAIIFTLYADMRSALEQIR